MNTSETWYFTYINFPYNTFMSTMSSIVRWTGWLPRAAQNINVSLRCMDIIEALGWLNPVINVVVNYSRIKSKGVSGLCML